MIAAAASTWPAVSSIDSSRVRRTARTPGGTASAPGASTPPAASASTTYSGSPSAASPMRARAAADRDVGPTLLDEGSTAAGDKSLEARRGGRRLGQHRHRRSRRQPGTSSSRQARTRTAGRSASRRASTASASSDAPSTNCRSSIHSAPGTGPDVTASRPSAMAPTSRACAVASGAVRAGRSAARRIERRHEPWPVRRERPDPGSPAASLAAGSRRAARRRSTMDAVGDGAFASMAARRQDDAPARPDPLVHGLAQPGLADARLAGQGDDPTMPVGAGRPRWPPRCSASAASRPMSGGVAGAGTAGGRCAARSRCAAARRWPRRARPGRRRGWPRSGPWSWPAGRPRARAPGRRRRRGTGGRPPPDRRQRRTAR